ncbi:hypothetical protein BCU19_15825 [Vibrio cyclitrophicus]|uniref:hypothetical protein n=1 Tax=Vibrio cyclitrophicus TaxID=47951 RepID=UPI000C867114|nr:hypothetical protein [Vibrio cyclitrophicus]PMJ53485.1 hypothetical protein BCU19_19080 [Vibrio cyclitrophicus]
MQHCETKLFKDENYCGDCGETLPKFVKNSIDQVHPELVSNIKSEFPNAELVTGEIISINYAKEMVGGVETTKEDEYDGKNRTKTRTYTDNTKEYSLWNTKVVDSDGELHEFKIIAEAEATRNLHKGDIITVFNVGIDDVIGEEVITIHKDDGQDQFIKPSLVKKPEKQSPSFGLTLAIAIFLLAFWQTNNLELSLIAGVAIGAILFGLEYSHHSSNFKNSIIKYNQRLDFYSSMLQITKQSLGYLPSKRPRLESDILCSSCTKRIASDSAYCAFCGTNTTEEQQEPSETTLFTSSDHPALEIVSTQSQANGESADEPLPSKPANQLSIQQIKSNLEGEYNSQFNTDYLHKLVLAGDIKFNVVNNFYLGQVLDIDTNADVQYKSESKKEISGTDKETDHYEFSHFTKSYNYTHTEIERKRNIESYITDTRTSELSQVLLLQTMDGNLTELHMPTGMTGKIQRGDWLAIKDYTLSSDNKAFQKHNEQDKFLESIYNITQESEYSIDDGFKGFEFRLGFVRSLYALIPVVALSFLFPPLFALYFLVVCFGMLATPFAKKRNKKAREFIINEAKAPWIKLKGDLPSIQTLTKKIS